jgi:hypothetical protein
MKLWRDFKLLALCAGLLAVDGCRPDKDGWEEDDLGNHYGTVVANEPSCGKFGSTVFAISPTAGLGNVDDYPPQFRIRTVPGQYRGKSYERLVRIEYQTANVPNSDRDSYLRAGIGACVKLHPRRGELPPLPCANDNIPVYANSGGLRWPNPADCSGVADPR